MAPELCGKKSYKGSEADMWSLGIVFYTILFGKQPFHAKTEADLFQKIM
jgi:serine/threonine protein kinase